MKKVIILVFFFTQILAAQEEHAWVYFTDKQNVAASIANPTTILTAKAIARKTMFSIPIDERDVPVNETYITSIKGQTGITVKAKSKWFNCVHVIGTKINIDALEALNFVDHIVYADRSLNIVNRTSTVVSDTRFNTKLETFVTYNYGNSSNQVQMIKVEKLHELDYTGEGVTVAVLDAGFTNVNTMNAFQRLRTNGDLLDGYDFVDRTNDIYAYTGNSHGTLVLSDMAGYIDAQFVGTAPDASYYLFRTEDAGSETPVEETYWVEAAERADSLGVDIINTSLGYNRFDEAKYDYTTSDMDGNTTFITKGANIAVEKGILVVNSAGNSGNDSTWGIITAPGDGDVFTVGAVNASGNYASFSSRGFTADGRVKPDVVAQGASVYVINTSDVVVTSSGTSFSSPIIAGAMACLRQALPNKTNQELMQLVRESASIYTMPTIQLGYGIPNFEQTLQILSIEENIEKSVTIYPNPVHTNLYLTLSNESRKIQATIRTLLGAYVKSFEVDPTIESIDFSFLKPGIYVLQLNIDGFQFAKKIIKQ